MDVFGILAILVFGGAVASYIVARFVHQPLRAASAGEEDFVLDHEFRYYDELESLESRPLDRAELIALRKRVALDDTPCGRVAMTYQHEDGRFEYWSERNHIPYKTLDTVARKFCVENDCRAVYLDVYEELYRHCTRASARHGGSPLSSSSDDDAALLYGDDERERHGPGKEASPIFELDEGPPPPPPYALERSDAVALADVAPEAPEGVFAAFKDYNAPASRSAKGAAEAEPPTKNTFMRLGSMHEWERTCQEQRPTAQTSRALSYAEFASGNVNGDNNDRLF